MKNNDWSGVDQGLFVDVIRSSLEIRNREQFTAWARNELRILFPHKMLLCCFGRMDRSGPKLKAAIGIDWPVEYNNETIVNADGNVSSPIVARWLEEQRPQLFQPGDGQFVAPPQGWLANFKKHDLRNIAAHGVFDQDRRTATYFKFSQIDENLNDHHALLLELLVPHMHQAFVRVVSRERKEVVRKQQPSNLTNKEIVIMQWLAAGKTNIEIAAILSRSPCTVRNQIHVILTKLNVVCRAQAVAAATEMKLIRSNQ